MTQHDYDDEQYGDPEPGSHDGEGDFLPPALDPVETGLATVPPVVEPLVTADLARGMGYDQITSFDSVGAITLRMDHDAGTLVYGGKAGEPIGRHVWGTIVQWQRYRQLWECDYKDLAEGQDNRIACFSADSQRAYGLGRRPVLPGDADWMSQLAEQDCEACPSAKWTKDRASGKWDCVCPMRMAMFILVSVGGQWVPAIYHAHGLSYRAAEQVSSQAFRAMEMTKRKALDGSVTYGLPIFHIPWRLEMRPNKDLYPSKKPIPKGYSMTWSRADRNMQPGSAAATATMDFVSQNGESILAALRASLVEMSGKIGQAVADETIAE